MKAHAPVVGLTQWPPTLPTQAGPRRHNDKVEVGMKRLLERVVEVVHRERSEIPALGAENDVKQVVPPQRGAVDFSGPCRRPGLGGGVSRTPRKAKAFVAEPMPTPS
jgi:hypothetical protein